MFHLKKHEWWILLIYTSLHSTKKNPIRMLFHHLDKLKDIRGRIQNATYHVNLKNYKYFMNGIFSSLNTLLRKPESSCFRDPIQKCQNWDTLYMSWNCKGELKWNVLYLKQNFSHSQVLNFVEIFNWSSIFLFQSTFEPRYELYPEIFPIFYFSRRWYLWLSSGTKDCRRTVTIKIQNWVFYSRLFYQLHSKKHYQ